VADIAPLCQPKPAELQVQTGHPKSSYQSPALLDSSVWVSFVLFLLQAKIERENNLKDFKSAYDIETAPKFGAGSEYGRDQREEARKKKFGVRIRKYNSDDQPWLLKLGGGSGTQPRRYWRIALSALILFQYKA